MSSTYNRASICRDTSGDILGVPLFLGESDISSLELDVTEIDTLCYDIQEDKIQLSKPNGIATEKQ